MRISDWSSDVCSSDLKTLPDQKLRCIVSDDPYVLGVLSSRIHALFSSRLGGRHGVGNTPVSNTKCATALAFPADPPDNRNAKIPEETEALAALRKRVMAVHADLQLPTLYNLHKPLRQERPLTRP